jgi:hypothetical protein
MISLPRHNVAPKDGRPSEVRDSPAPNVSRPAPHFGLASRYALAPSVFISPTRHGAVLLDLARNRYFGVGPKEARILELLGGKPSASATETASAISVAPEYGIEESSICLLEKIGVIHRGPPQEREIMSCNVQLNGALIAIGDEITCPVTVRLSHVVAFVKALMVSWYSLRFRPIASTARRVYGRRAAAITRGYTFDLHRIAEFVCIFRRIRPFVFTVNGHCILHALTLVTFLSRYGEFPLWVLGVKVDPWAAHSWVQLDNFLLDTNPEKVCKFNPILAV